MLNKILANRPGVINRLEEKKARLLYAAYDVVNLCDDQNTDDFIEAVKELDEVIGYIRGAEQI